MANPLSKVRTGIVRCGGETIHLVSELGAALVEDLSRWAEKILTDEQLRAEWSISDAEWQAIKSNTDVVGAVRRRKQVRVAAGISTKEAARQFYAAAPAVLKDLMADTAAPGRTRIEAARELRQQAGYSDEATAQGAAEHFSLTINIGDGAPRQIEVAGVGATRFSHGPILDADREEGITPGVSPSQIDWSSLGLDPATSSARKRDAAALAATTLSGEGDDDE